jgi:NAD(P)H-hydrate epimerase
MYPKSTRPVPALTTPQMIEVDRAMIEDYGIELIQMMENAGRNLAHLARARFLNGDPRGRFVVVLAGTGGNGGGALVCARHLHNYGADVRVFTTRPGGEFTPIAKHQLEILKRMRAPIAPAGAIDGIKTTGLIIDGIIGYSLQGAPRDTAASLIEWANRQAAPILALDAPSGLDASSGVIYEPAIRATATMTLALPKVGLLTEQAEGVVGELFLADISVPPSLYAGPALQISVGPVFATSDLIRIR